jgi:surfeit locus 1 family protein
MSARWSEYNRGGCGAFAFEFRRRMPKRLSHLRFRLFQTRRRRRCNVHGDDRSIPRGRRKTSAQIMIRGRWVWFAALIGFGGTILGLALGAWQVDRLSQKRRQISQIEQGLAAVPKAVTGFERREVHNFSPVFAEGRFDLSAPVARYLTSQKPYGAGFRLISAFTLSSGERILVDRGFAPQKAVPRGGKAPAPPAQMVTLSGVLHWPNEANRFTPDANITEKIWFARNVESLSAVLDTRPVLLVMTRRPDDSAANDVKPLGVVVDVANNHLSYAITWFSLAAIWAGMTGSLFFQRRSKGI